MKKLFLVFLCLALNLNADEKPIVVVMASYNNAQWYEANLSSALSQNYSNYRIIYVNDCSKDNTGALVEEYLKAHCNDYKVIYFDESSCNSIVEKVDRFSEMINEEEHFFILVNNVKRCGALENLYRAIQSCKDNEIIATLDGDDWFYHNNVLKDLNEVYVTNDVWFTHGTLMEYPWGHVSWCEPIPEEAIINKTYRKYKCPSHLRTFYTWLFKKIKLEDFLFDGVFFPMTWDMAIMFPLCEMAEERHAFIKEVNYVYNMANSINDNKVNAKLQNELDYYIRHMPPYQRLNEDEVNVCN